jgi:hypothetical protein
MILGCIGSPVTYSLQRKFGSLFLIALTQFMQGKAISYKNSRQAIKNPYSIPHMGKRFKVVIKR